MSIISFLAFSLSSVVVSWQLSLFKRNKQELISPDLNCFFWFFTWLNNLSNTNFVLFSFIIEFLNVKIKNLLILKTLEHIFFSINLLFVPYPGKSIK